MVAGGSVLNLILQNKYIVPITDVDIFLVNTTSDKHARKVVKTLILYLLDLSVGDYSITRGKFAINLNMAFNYQDYHTRLDFQIILRRYNSPTEVLHGFDLDASGVGYYKGKYYATKRALYSISKMILHIDLERLSESYNYRLAKYSAQKGFTIVSPLPFPIEVLNTALKFNISRRGRTLDTKMLYNSDMNSTLEGLIILFRLIHKKRWNKDIISDYYKEASHSTNNPEEDLISIYQDSSNKTVSYEIKNDILEKNDTLDKLQILWNRPSSGINGQPKEIQVKLMAAMMAMDGGPLLEKNSAISRRIKFITQDPGRQFTGSFHPLNYDLNHWNGIIDPTPVLFVDSSSATSSSEDSSSAASSEDSRSRTQPTPGTFSSFKNIKYLTREGKMEILEFMLQRDKINKQDYDSLVSMVDEYNDLTLVNLYGIIKDFKNDLTMADFYHIIYELYKRSDAYSTSNFVAI